MFDQEHTHIENKLTVTNIVWHKFTVILTNNFSFLVSYQIKYFINLNTNELEAVMMITAFS